MAGIHSITPSPLTLDQIVSIINENKTLALSELVAKKITDCREYLDRKLERSQEPIYGVNTGFGSLYDRKITRKNLEKLQENLVMSHACGTGREVPAEIVRLMLLLKIQSLSYGHSGAQLSTVERLIYFFNQGILPVIFEMGSLGASGDLAPLAHLSLPLIGKGQVRYNGELEETNQLFARIDLTPIRFKAKEGLALLNGTQFMGAYGIWALAHGRRLIKAANHIGALSLDAFDGRIEPFYEKVHELRPQKGQVDTACTIRELLKDSELIDQPKKHVQDPYSFRCIPQVHGACLDAWNFAHDIFDIEINSVTDNPNIFPGQDEIISAGNFHGQPLALALDFLCMALSELGNISERRTFQLISGARQLPYYLVAHPGINSGLMITQYTAAGLVSQNKQLCTPASVDSIVSSNGQEDHVSMGANAAVKSYQVIENVYNILGIELITAVQALEFRRPLKTSPALEEIVGNFRKSVPFIEDDRILHNDMMMAVKFLKSIEL